MSRKLIVLSIVIVIAIALFLSYGGLLYLETLSWKTFISQSKEYSFKYPQEVKLIDNRDGDLEFPYSDTFGNKTQVNVTQLPNELNQSVENFLKNGGYSEDMLGTSSIFKIDETSVFSIYDKEANEEDAYIYGGKYIYRISLIDISNYEKSRKLFYKILKTFHAKSPQNITTGVTVDNGDIIVMVNGQRKKITDYGHNFDPVLSPDKTKVAYLSETKETLYDKEEKKKTPGFIKISQNVWIINIDGTKPLQLTQHIDFVPRGHLHWLDNERLVFTEGEQSAKVYSLSTNSFQTILGPDIPVPVCVDACGYGVEFKYNGDFTKLIRIEKNPSVEKISEVDLKTFERVNRSN